MSSLEAVVGALRTRIFPPWDCGADEIARDEVVVGGRLGRFFFTIRLLQ